MSEARKLRGGRASREDDEEFFCLSTEVNNIPKMTMIIIFHCGENTNDSQNQNMRSTHACNQLIADQNDNQMMTSTYDVRSTPAIS